MGSTRVLKAAMAAALFLTAGCAANPISKTTRREARKGVTLSMAAADPAAHAGELVIWGGYIVDTVNYSSFTEITVLDTPMNGCSGEPERVEEADGRFLARLDGFLDPAVYRKGRKVTAAGTVSGRETRELGKLDYNYVILQVKEIHLWPRGKPCLYDPMFDYSFWYGPPL